MEAPNKLLETEINSLNIISLLLLRKVLRGRGKREMFFSF